MKKTILSSLLFLLLLSSSAYAQKVNKNESVPEWAKKVVWYQIFPERFMNGDKSNDPTLETLKGSWPNDNQSPWEIHPWTSDWYELQNYEKKNGQDIWFNIQRRRYGGDIQGIIDKLDYLEKLGINAIYINPIFESPSLHKYDSATYHHVDPNFGPNPNGDRALIKTENPEDPNTWVWTDADKLFLKLVKEVHKRHMYIIIDGVFNHMGINSWAFQDVLKNQEKSKFKDWFTVKSWNDSAKGTTFDYEGWFGVKELPELREDENGIVKGPKDYIFNITKRWMAPNGIVQDGIDGWRLDVAFCVNHKFWKDWRKEVKSINKNSYITAEIIDTPEAVKPYVMGDEFDAVMNYNFLFANSEFFIDDKTAISPSKFDSLLKDLREKTFPKDVSYIQQNLNNSHDTHRLLTGIVNRDKYKIRDWGTTFELRKGSNPNYDTRKPDKYEIAINKLMVIFQMTYVGAPYIYYGEELGMWGANDPDCRKPMIWEGLKYDDEKYLPNQTLKPVADKVEVDKDLFNHYKKLISIRLKNPELQLGSFKTLLVDDNKNIYAFERKLKNDEIIVIINNKNSAQEIDLNIKNLKAKKYKDLLNNDSVLKVENGKLKVNLKEKWGVILKKII